MKIVVVGGSGRIGSRLVTKLREPGYEVVSADLRSGVNTFTGDGLGQALREASVVVDVSDAPSYDDAAVLEFFETSTQHLLAAEAAAGVGHHVALSVVGTDRLGESGYFRAKQAQERQIMESSVPHSVVRATQFFEFLPRFAHGETDDDIVRLPRALIQPVAAADVAAALARASLREPVNGIVEVAGPELFPFDELIRRVLQAQGDGRRVVADQAALYFGARLGERTLLPSRNAELGATHFADWLDSSIASPGSAMTSGEGAERDA